MRLHYLLPLFLAFANVPNELIANNLKSKESHCELPAPTDLKIISTSPNAATVNWNTVSAAAEGYFVNLKNLSDNQIVYSAAIADTKVMFGELKSAVRYQITVYAVGVGGCVSTTGSTASFSTDFIIVDELMAGFQSFQPTNCSTDYPLGRFGILVSESVVEPFSVGISSTGVLRVSHGNSVCSGTACNPPQEGTSYQAGWHFGDGKTAPMVDGNSIYSKQIYCYYLPQALPSPFFPVNNPTLIIDVKATTTPSGTLVNLCTNSIYTLVRPSAQGLVSGQNNNSQARTVDGTSTSLPSVAPNPFTDAMTITFGSTTKQGSLLQLIDLNGVTHQVVNLPEGLEKWEVQTAALVPGFYFLHYFVGSEVQTFRVLKTVN